ncbi:MAG: chorismate mutase [Gemmatimonadota bacterium]
MSVRGVILRALRVPTVRAVRGATTVPSDDAVAMHDAVSELLLAITRANALAADEVISALFTVTPDLVSAFPAQAARLGGWDGVPLLCATEIAVPGSLERCVRILLHVTRAWSDPPRHVYLRNAAALRPDLSSGG